MITEEEAKRECCRLAWYDGKHSHVCYQDKGHKPPCKCRGCGQVEGAPPVTGTAGGPR